MTNGGSHDAPAGFATGFFAVVVVGAADADAAAAASDPGSSRSAAGVVGAIGAIVEEAADVDVVGFGAAGFVVALGGGGVGSMFGLGTGGVVTFGFVGTTFGAGSEIGCPRFAIAYPPRPAPASARIIDAARRR